MSEILLINPKTGTERYSYPQLPLNLLCLGSILTENYHHVKILDMPVIPDERKALTSLNRFDYIAVSSMTGTQILSGLKISSYIKQYTSSPIIWGGIHPTLFPEQTVSNENIDIVVRGEGEYTLLDIAEGKKLEDIKGITYKNNGDIISNPDREFCDMNNLPPTNWGLIDPEIYIKPSAYIDAKRVLPLHASRGCPHNCAFCVNLLVNKRRFRSKNAENTFEEFKYIVNKFKLDGVQMREDNFCTDVKRIHKLSELIQQEKLDVKINCSLRADKFKDNALLKDLVGMNVTAIGMGAESGSPRILNLIDKNITPEDIINSAIKAKELNIKTIYSFILGIPTETKEDINLTLNLIDKIKNINPDCDVTNINIYTPYPSNKLFNTCKSLGFQEPASLEQWGNFIWDNVNIPWIVNKNLVETINQVSIFALNNQAINNIRKRNVIFNIAGYLLQRIEKHRWKNRIWNLPYELRLIRYMRRLNEF